MPISASVKWEPRGKRRLHKTPAQREIDACGYRLDQELAQVPPEVIVALASTALRAVLGSGNIALKDTLGKPIRHGWRWAVTVCPPSYVPPRCGTRRRRRVDGLKLAQRLLARNGDNWCVRMLVPAPAATNRLLWPCAIFHNPSNRKFLLWRVNAMFDDEKGCD